MCIFNHSYTIILSTHHIIYARLNYFTSINLIYKMGRVSVTNNIINWGKFGNAKALASSIYKIKKTSILYETIILKFERAFIITA